MGRSKRTSIKFKQKEKRKKERVKLAKKGKDPNEFFSSGIYIGKPLK
ncbi:MAG: hypothetical protein ISS90_01030 [Candidatus Omnitrophica bacterium]|nr:hypothetical protein [Candidatus Omnitrophota bacterium]